MKISLGKMILATMIMSLGFSAKADVCESKDGWRVATNPLQVGSTRVPGNTIVLVSNPDGAVVLSFSATSEFAGKEPDLWGGIDNYLIETIWNDELGLKEFSWNHYNKCLRCSENSGWYEQNYIKILTENKSYTIHCNK